MATLRLCLYLLALVSLPLIVCNENIPYNYGFDVSQHVKRQMGRPLIVRGASSGRTIQPRQEIRQLEQDRDLWTLYILGLSMLQYTDQSSPTSWYGLTGIHGIPHQTWGGVGPTRGNEATGYCTHSSVLFPTWHRPYLALYEQVLYDLVQLIAGFWQEGDERDRYLAAAARFRIPYWDWAAVPPNGESVLPLSVGGNSYVDVEGPNGRQRISNPLFSYSFKPLNATAFLQHPWDVWTSTFRSPTRNDNRAQSNNALVARNFDQLVASLSQRLYILFASYANYTTFSNNAWIPRTNNTSYDSLESLHDTVHTLAGGGGMGQPNPQGGHMSYIPYSAFDPIFFLHHANVDRIFAMWQVLFSDSWVIPQPAALPSYTTSAGQIQDSTTALTPFFASEDGTFWTSDMVRDHTRFAYTYDLGGSQSGTSNRTKARVNRIINQLYGSSSAASLFTKDIGGRGLGSTRAGKYSRRWGNGRFGPGRAGLDATLGHVKSVVFHGDKYREWLVNIRVKQQALSEPFGIHFFFGGNPGDPHEWTSAGGHIGSLGVFASDDGHGMSMGGLEVSGTVPLTADLVDKIVTGDLPSLRPQHVEEYLKANLRQRVLTVSGKVYDAADIDSLAMYVASSVVRAPATDEELPEWGRVEVHFQLR